MDQVYPTQVYSKQQLDKFIYEFKKKQPITRIKFLFKLPMHSNVAEIGVAEGNFSECILRINKPKNLHLIDSWKFQKGESFSEDWSNASQNEQNRRYTSVKHKFSKHPNVKIHRKYSLDAARSFPNQFFNWIYIDANHTYKAVKDDLEAWYPKIKRNGIIAGHDYTNKPYFPMGVIQAVDELVEKNNLEMFLIDNDPWHSWALKRKTKHVTLTGKSKYLITQLKRSAAKSQKFEKTVALGAILRNKIISQFKKS